MPYIRQMPKDPNKKRVEVHLTPEQYKIFTEHAKEKYWSNKRLAEIIVSNYLESIKKKKK